MKAKLLRRDSALTLYTLDRGGDDGDEIKSFLSKVDDRNLKSVVIGFLHQFKNVARHGFSSIPKEWWDCWPVKSNRFCEFIKGDWRISYHYFPAIQRVLLLTVFRKYNMKANRDYKRALNLYNEFSANQDWEV